MLSLCPEFHRWQKLTRKWVLHEYCTQHVGNSQWKRNRSSSPPFLAMFILRIQSALHVSKLNLRRRRMAEDVCLALTIFFKTGAIGFVNSIQLLLSLRNCGQHKALLWFLVGFSKALYEFKVDVYSWIDSTSQAILEHALSVIYYFYPRVTRMRAFYWFHTNIKNGGQIHTPLAQVPKLIDEFNFTVCDVTLHRACRIKATLKHGINRHPHVTNLMYELRCDVLQNMINFWCLWNEIISFPNDLYLHQISSFSLRVYKQ